MTDTHEPANIQTVVSARCLQLSPGRLAAWLTHVRLPGLGLVQGVAHCATRQQGLPWGDQPGPLGQPGHAGLQGQPGHAGLQGRPGHAGPQGQVAQAGPVVLAMAVDLPSPARFNAQRVGPDAIMIGHADALDLCLPAGAGLIAVAVDAALLAQAWQQLYRKPLSAWINQPLVVQASPAPAAALRQQHLATLARLAAQPTLLDDAAAVLKLRDSLLLEWLEAIPPRVDASALPAARARQRVVDRACALVLGQPDAAWTMAQVSHQIGTSPRKLADCFASVLGFSPARYLRTARLNAARRDLCQQPGASVQDVAARWGFGHEGDFAAAYRRLFGEKPSDTLRLASASGTAKVTATNPANPACPACPSAHTRSSAMPSSP